jgi:hypothetical protein
MTSSAKITWTELKVAPTVVLKCICTHTKHSRITPTKRDTCPPFNKKHIQSRYRHHLCLPGCGPRLVVKDIWSIIRRHLVVKVILPIANLLLGRKLPPHPPPSSSCSPPLLVGVYARLRGCHGARDWCTNRTPFVVTLVCARRLQARDHHISFTHHTPRKSPLVYSCTVLCTVASVGISPRPSRVPWVAKGRSKGRT